MIERVTMYCAKCDHCKKESGEIKGFMRYAFGYKYPDDILKCWRVKKAIADSPFLKG